MVTPSVKTGVGRYIDGRLAGLTRFVVFVGRNQTDHPELPSGRFTVRRAPVSTDDSVCALLWKTFVLPLLLVDGIK